MNLTMYLLVPMMVKLFQMPKKLVIIVLSRLKKLKIQYNHIQKNIPSGLKLLFQKWKRILKQQPIDRSAEKKIRVKQVYKI